MNKKSSLDKDYENYRWFFTSNNVLVIGGKSDEQNEIALKKFLRPEYTVMHTSAPGSSFMIIQSEKPAKKDLDETAIFTACFSKQWKSTSSDIEIDIFQGSQIYKTKSPQTGAFVFSGLIKF
jgi:predicted ribosome quality control (RQC) complex YloA/Tae2 family protein